MRADSHESEPAIDLPLREGDVGPDSGDGPTRDAESGGAHLEPPAQRGLTALLGMLVLGLLSGFGAGFVVGQRLDVPAPARAVEVPRPAPVAAPPPVPAEPSAPHAIEPVGAPAEPVPAPPVVESAVAVLDAEVRPPEPAPKPAARPAPPAVRPAIVRFDSRPPGATIYFDEVRIGVTPLTLNDVLPGDHQVRLEMLGHDTWRTSVAVKPGEQYFLGASLE